MTMFAMLIVVFVVSTTRSRQQAEHMAKAILESTKGSDGNSTITSNFDDALEKLLVGDDFKSVLAPHSILENLYGHPNFDTNENLYGTITDNSADANGYIEITTNLKFDDSDDYTKSDLTGNVLTVIEVPDIDVSDLNYLEREKKLQRKEKLQKTKGKSTFIIDTTSNGFQIAPFDVTFKIDDLKDCKFIINSPAFGGTGPGFNSEATGAALNIGDSNSIPYALRPNVLAPKSGATPAQEYKKYLNDNLVLMNPDYTAPDYLNMFLAWNNVQWNKTKEKWVLGDSIYPLMPKMIPSFHRPQLLKYWESDITTQKVDYVNTNTEWDQYLNEYWNNLRKIVLRPLPGDHPNFTGSNPTAQYNLVETMSTPLKRIEVKRIFKFLTGGSWDVDNDGDGVADGIWIDAGLGTTSIDGKRYKKLVSYYVLDMDGRLNVNVHGTKEHDKKYNPDFDSVLRGSGSGTAEVRLDLGLKTIKADNFSQIINGNSSSDETGRYKISGKPSNGTDFDVMMMNIYQNVYNVGGNGSDWWGNDPITSDALGNRAITPNTNNIFAGNPYLMNPYSQGNDLPFDISDLQYLLRSVGDIDYAALPKRLRNLLGEAATDQYKLSPYRFFLTTRSSDIPVPGNSSGLYLYIFNEIAGGRTANDALKLAFNDNDDDATEDAQQKIDDARKKAKALFQFLPEKIRRGEKINLNQLTFRNDWTTGSNAALLKEKAKFAQEIFYLLCVLGYDQIEKPAPNNYTEGSLTAKADIYTRLAQWSVNLVDFIDPDATMTPFVFSTNPFSKLHSKLQTNGTPFDAENDIFDNKDDIATIVTSANWSPPTDIKLLWGFEKPEVALTETFAVHNRRVADSVKERGDTTDEICETCGYDKRRINNACTADPNPHDTGFDQVLIPQGSLFVELYRQGNPNRIGYPKNDIVNSTTDPDPGNLNLAKTATDGSYIWRLVVGKKTTSGELGKWTETSSDDNDALSQSRTDETYQFGLKYPFPGGTGTANGIEPERIIWFGKDMPSGTENYSYINVGGAVTDTNGNIIQEKKSGKYLIGKNAYTNEANVTLEPNEYLVIGPRLYTSFDSQPLLPVPPLEPEPVPLPVTKFGTPKTSGQNEINLRALVGVKSMVAAMNVPDSWTTGIPRLGKKMEGIGVSVSEPLRNTYYPEPAVESSSELSAKLDPRDPNDPPNNPADDPVNDSANSPKRIPFYDGYAETNAESPQDADELLAFGTIPCYKTIYLQRLADPNRAYHEVTNPYIIVDWNMIDLHVINSEQDDSPEGKADETGKKPKGLTRDKEADNNFVTTPIAKKDLYFTSRQWGYTGLPNGDTTQPNLWSRIMKNGGVSSMAGLQGTPLSITSALNYSNDLTLGSLNKYTGSPNVAFAHFPWHDAPLANSYELMLVPVITAGRFGLEFFDNGSNDFFHSKIKSLGVGSSTNQPRFSNPDSYIGPYLNFLHNSVPEPVPPKTSPPSITSLDLWRLFEYVRVPSKFGGTIRGWETGTNPKPIYEMREPGKINLNTATQPVWDALQGSTKRIKWRENYSLLVDINGDGIPDDINKDGIPDIPMDINGDGKPDALDTDGNGSPDVPLPFDIDGDGFPDNVDINDIYLNPDYFFAFRHKEATEAIRYNNVYPSEFIPFRSSRAVNLVPPLKTGHENDLVQKPEDATLLRKITKPDPEDTSGSTTISIPIVEPEPNSNNPYTLLESYMRFPDMTTTRSNVFAVWMTIGYFEVKDYTVYGDKRVDELWNDYSAENIKNHFPFPNPINTTQKQANLDYFDVVYPDGYVLGVEKGLDNSTVKRHRAFYLLDRSTPVGFRRGEKYTRGDGKPHYNPVIVGSKTLE